jgi:hypothetical protein
MPLQRTLIALVALRKHLQSMRLVAAFVEPGS